MYGSINKVRERRERNPRVSRLARILLTHEIERVYLAGGNGNPAAAAAASSSYARILWILTRKPSPGQWGTVKGYYARACYVYVRGRESIDSARAGVFLPFSSALEERERIRAKFA